MANWSNDVPGPYHSLIDAERAAAESEGKPSNRLSLIKRLRAATPIGLREAKDAVEDYLMRTSGVAGGKADWVDSFLDAERAAADREGRPISQVLLIRALREASGLDLGSAKLAVDHYLERRGASLPFSTGGLGCVIASLIGTLLLVGLGLAYLLFAA